MDLKDAEFLAKTLMGHYLVDHDFTFGWDRSVNRFGQCLHEKKKITLSRPLTESNGYELVKDTILHEIAHANLGPGYGHGTEWKREARRLGADPAASHPDPSNLEASAPWVGRCARGHESRKRFWRKPKVARSCNVCYPGKYNENYVLTYTKEEA